MENKNLVHTEYVNGKGKSFYLDLKENTSGRNYLVITQSRKVDDDNRERTKIILFENEIGKFSEAMMRSMLRFSMDKSAMDNHIRYPKAFSRWSEVDEQRLKDMHAEGVQVEELTVQLGRNTGAVIARLQKLGLMIPEETVATA